jgi:hypothetical protein
MKVEGHWQTASGGEADDAGAIAEAEAAGGPRLRSRSRRGCRRRRRLGSLFFAGFLTKVWQSVAVSVRHDHGAVGLIGLGVFPPLVYVPVGVGVALDPKHAAVLMVHPCIELTVGLVSRTLKGSASGVSRYFVNAGVAIEVGFSTTQLAGVVEVLPAIDDTIEVDVDSAA